MSGEKMGIDPVNIKDRQIKLTENLSKKEKMVAEAITLLSAEYQVFWDKRAGEGQGLPPEKEKELFEFVDNLNPNYLQFLNKMLDSKITKSRLENKSDVEKKNDWEKSCIEFEKQLEFFRNNYALPLNDEEAIEALMFLQKDKKEIAEQKVKAWRDLSRQFGYSRQKETKEQNDNKPIIWLARAGFNIKEAAPKVRDEKNPNKNKGICYKDFKYLQNWNFPDQYLHNHGRSSANR